MVVPGGLGLFVRLLVLLLEQVLQHRVVGGVGAELRDDFVVRGHGERLAQDGRHERPSGSGSTVIEKYKYSDK